MTASEFSAGGVVVNEDHEIVVIVPTRRAADGSKVLALPKGHPDAGESPVEAALREVREEAGVEAEAVDSLGEVRYWYQRNGRRIAKVVEFFLLRYVSGDVGDHDHEVEHARWVPATEALETLTYAGERDMVREALSRLERGL
ncbi:MAG TPA: NUDIX domain-containing protein [Solirubrobacteraceae bacterium]|nr:NUDIX domain-containing protein [Solirubrobacteraceae bacterium]